MQEEGENVPEPPPVQTNVPVGENPATEAVHVVGCPTVAGAGLQLTVVDVGVGVADMPKVPLLGGLFESPP